MSLDPYDMKHFQLERLSQEMERFYRFASATFSDADHMHHDVPAPEAARYFQRNRETMKEQLRLLNQAFNRLDNLTKGTTDAP